MRLLHCYVSHKYRKKLEAEKWDIILKVWMNSSTNTNIVTCQKIKPNVYIESVHTSPLSTPPHTLGLEDSSFVRNLLLRTHGSARRKDFSTCTNTIPQLVLPEWVCGHGIQTRQALDSMFPTTDEDSKGLGCCTEGSHSHCFWWHLLCRAFFQCQLRVIKSYIWSRWTKYSSIVISWRRRVAPGK